MFFSSLIGINRLKVISFSLSKLLKLCAVKPHEKMLNIV